MSDYKKLNNHPLELVLVEVRYSPILNVKKYIPELHDQLRGDFPNFNTVVDKTVNFNNDQVDFSNIERWLFTSKDGQRVVDIDQNRVVYATTKYDRFDGFQADVQQIVEVLKNIVNPSIYTRVGLRYCDNIPSLDGGDTGLSELVVPQLLFDDTFSNIGQKGFKRQEYLIATGTTHLVIRTVQTVTPNVLPEDLISIGLKVKADETAKLRLLLDFDHFWQDPNNPKDFEVDNILETLSGLHEASREAFWNATTPYARDEIWL
ncbi:TIGR04255 family protein [Vibrio misgurnus]|uniref:TIGR04255 family protein n=1 Tax=Vibrio misgurnus TaxID=2993714 RepID=UPI002415D801|nr:TIGR04255 family protein [Vibrio sp. gvc]